MDATTSEKDTHEEQLEALNEVAHELMQAETADEIAQRGVAAVESILGFDISCVRMFNSETNALEIVAMTTEAERLCSSRPAYDLEATHAGKAYRRGEAVSRLVNEEDPDDDSVPPRDLHLPLGDHGVLSVLRSSDCEFAESDVQLAGLLATNLRSALDRAEREQLLRSRQNECIQQREQLETLNRIQSILREIIRALVKAATREEIERTVCERLAGSKLYESAWIGKIDMEWLGDDGMENKVITPQTGSGVDEEFLQAIGRMDISRIEHGTVETAIRTGTVQMLQLIESDLDVGPVEGSTEQATEKTEAIIATPLRHGEQVYGILVVHATREDVINEAAREGFGTLGETIGFAINAVRTKELILSDTVIELEFEITDPRSIVVNLSDQLDCQCQLEGTAPTKGGNFVHYVRIEDTDRSAEDVLEVARAMDNVEEYRIISEHDTGFVLEVIKTESPPRTLLDIGARTRTCIGTNGTAQVIAEAPQGANIREIVNAYQRAYGATLVAKREFDRPVKTADEFSRAADDQLTERQKTAIESAYLAGYYEWPRRSTAEEIADSLDISSSTFHEHLRVAERKLLSALIEHRNSLL